MADPLVVEGFPIRVVTDDNELRLVAEAVNRLAGLVLGQELGDAQPTQDTTVNSTSRVDLEGVSFQIVSPTVASLRIVAELDIEVTTPRLLTVDILVDDVPVRTRKWNPQAAELMSNPAVHTFPMTVTAPVLRLPLDSVARVKVQAFTESGGSFTIKASSVVYYTLIPQEE